jgi:uracil-DNA glycosylase
MSTIDLKEIQQKLYEKLKPSGWADKLKGFILSDEFYKILLTLYGDVNNGNRFTPGLKNLFRAFEECPYNELKLIILNAEPYSKAGVADGIAFSCANSDKMQASLKYMYKEIDNTINEFHDHDKDLSKWSNQGVLLLNASLTARIGEPMMHAQLWKPFMNYLFDMLNNYNTGLLYVFMGAQAKEWRTSISKNNFKFFPTHPASAAYKDADSWDSGNLFNQINKVMYDHYKTEIKW